MKGEFELIESTEDLIADTLIMDMLMLVKKWKDSSDNDEVKKMSSDIVQLVAYISKIRIDRASARATVTEQRRLKLELDAQISKMISND